VYVCMYYILISITFPCFIYFFTMSHLWKYFPEKRLDFYWLCFVLRLKQFDYSLKLERSPHFLKQVFQQCMQIENIEF
jgi:hypothetical protein